MRLALTEKSGCKNLTASMLAVRIAELTAANHGRIPRVASATVRSDPRQDAREEREVVEFPKVF